VPLLHRAAEIGFVGEGDDVLQAALVHGAMRELHRFWTDNALDRNMAGLE
jgi:hypothetical protein